MPRHHSHPKYIQLFKNILAILAFIFPTYLLLTSISDVAPNNALTVLLLIIISFFMVISLLVTAYFWQEIWMDEDGLLVEFLWRKFRVRWADIIETKAAWGFLGPAEKCPIVVLVSGLTPFHRAFGVLYGWSSKPGFVIFPSISDFQILKESILKHIKS